tara:strand:+ start:920 stop:1099 length:180 start_codon:yes stop_codon:yes gene_type:complete
LKIFLTKFTHNGKDYSGPNIHAKSMFDAEVIAEDQGLEVEGELTDLIDLDLDSELSVLH